MREPLLQLYGDRTDAKAQVDAIFDCVVDAYLERPESLRLLDLERQLTPDWYERPNMVGYVFYPEKFAGRLRDVQERLDYLQEMGVSYLHIMSLLKPRPGKKMMAVMPSWTTALSLPGWAPWTTWTH